MPTAALNHSPDLEFHPLARARYWGASICAPKDFNYGHNLIPRRRPRPRPRDQTLQNRMKVVLYLSAADSFSNHTSFVMTGGFLPYHERGSTSNFYPSDDVHV